MRISDVMTRALPTVSPDQSVRDAARTMTELSVKALPVCEAEQLVGIITDWDLAKAVAGDEDLSQLSLASVMSTDLVQVSPDATFTEAAQVMADRQVHHLLVSEDGRYAGMVHLDVEWSELTESLSGAPMATFAARI
jgi:CBS domain-containing protein